MPGVSLLSPDGAFLELGGRVEHRGSVFDRDDIEVVTAFTASPLGETRVRVPPPPEPATSDQELPAARTARNR